VHRLAEETLHLLSDTPLLADGYYRGFWNRNDSVLEIKVARQRDNCRQSWGTFRNMKAMHECVPEEMIKAGVARGHPE
jgi:hypothetical protein